MGFLLFPWIKDIPKALPNYRDKNLSPYFHFDELKDCDTQYLFVSELIKRIADMKYQEIGSHTYSHYYCSEKGRTKEEFQCDLAKTKKVLRPYDENIRSLILSRNQVNRAYMEIIREESFETYHGHEKMWIYEPCGLKKYNGLFDVS